MNERCEGAESQIEELKVELLDMEGILSTNKTELSSISEQLAEVSNIEKLLISICSYKPATVLHVVS